MCLGIRRNGGYSAVTDAYRLVVYRIDGDLRDRGIVVLYGSRGVNVAVFVNEEHFLFINAAVCVLSVADIYLVARALDLYHTRLLKGHTDIRLPLG